MTCILYKDNDNLVEVTELKDSESGAFISDATVSCIIKDDEGNAIAGISWPQSMDFVIGSNGTYRAIIDKAADIVRGAFYTVEITATAPGGLDAKWELKVQGVLRTS